MAQTKLKQIAEAIFDARHKIILESDREPVLEVYIGITLWHEILSEFPSEEEGSLLFDVQKSGGNEICGCKVHRVLTDDYGFKVIEKREGENHG